MQDRSLRRWDWIAAILLFLLLQIPAARLVSTDWTPYLYWTETMAGTGAFLGLALGASRFGSRSAALLGLGYTCTILPWQLCAYFDDGRLPDRLGMVFVALGKAFQEFAQRQPVAEPLFFLFWVCLACWLISLTSGYSLARHRRVVTAMVLSGAALLVTQAYANYQPRGSWWLAIFALVLALLAGRVYFLDRRAGWSGTSLFVSEDSGGNLFSGLFLTASLAILAAWWLPSMPGSLENATQLWNRYVRPLRERLSNAVTSLSGPYGKPGDSFYGGTLAMGQVASGGDEVVLRVEVLESPEINLRYYWRGRVYSDYADGSWSAAPPAHLLFHADDPDVSVSDLSGRAWGLFRVTSEFPFQSLLYGPAPAVWLDRTADLTGIPTGPGSYDVYSWVPQAPLEKGTSYLVRSALRNPTVVELSESGQAYPAWVTADYLGVPKELQTRLERLAGDITASQDTAYDKAAAITEYLRRNIDYNVSVPAIPEGQDPVMWVLFDHKEGYCNYYASAEILLLRSIGIPARLAVGFSRGELIDGAYVVHRRDAHAWPEVYFPGVGWVEFEPTTNQAPLARPSGLNLVAGSAPVAPGRGREDGALDEFPELVELAPPAAPLPFRLTPTGRVVFASAPVLLAMLFVFAAFRLRVWSRVPSYVARSIEAGGGPVPSWLRAWETWLSLTPIERLFAPVGWVLGMLGHSQPASATPATRTRILSELIPSAATHAQYLRAQLESGIYANGIVDLRRSRVASLMVLLYGVRARWLRAVAVLNGSAVYSDPEFPFRTRGNR